jgi:hypothetical protein
VVTLLVTGASAAILSLGSRERDFAPPGPLGIGSFGDTLRSEFQQGWRNGTETYGMNDHLVPRDDFDGDYLDPNTWMNFSGPRGSTNLANGSVRHAISAGSTEHDAFVAFRGALAGDFEIVFDFRLTHWANNFGFGAFLGVCEESGGCGGGPPHLVGRANFTGNDSYIGTIPPTTLSEVKSTDLSGTFRLVRTGSTLAGSFWNSSSGDWETIFSDPAAPTGPMLVIVGVHESSTDPVVSGPVSAEFDDFRGDGTIAVAPFGPADTVRLLPYADNFDDSFRNLERWADPVLVDATTAETSGNLNQTCSNSGGLENAVQALRERLSGDFDVRVRFGLATVPQTGTWRATLGVEIGGLDYQMNRARGAGNQRYEAWAAGVLGSTALTSNVSGGLRLARTGATLTFLYGEEGDWSMLQSSAVGGGSAAVSLRIRCTGSPYPPLSVEFDMFQVSGDRGMSPATYADATLESRVIDTGETDPGNPKWGELYFNATTAAGTSVRFQLASSDSPSGPWTFTGPDGTAATWYTTAGSSAVLLDGDRYFRYRAELNSTNATSTPVLWDVAVTAEGPNIPEVSLPAAIAAVVPFVVFALATLRMLRRRQAPVSSRTPRAR